MNFEEMVERGRDALTVRRVFGEPYEKDGVTVIPAAAVRGGGGGGGGEDNAGNRGSGGGFGLAARPVGVYQVKDGEVTWIPAVDATRIAVLGQVVAIVFLLTVRSILKRRRRKG